MAAVAAGNKVAIRLLLSREDTEINGYSRFGETPLIIAIEKGDLKMVEMLLRTGRIDINSRDINAQISHSRDPEIPRLLFQLGANIAIEDDFGHTPLWWALSYDVLERSNQEAQNNHYCPTALLVQYLTESDLSIAIAIIRHDEANCMWAIQKTWKVYRNFGLKAKYHWKSQFGLSLLPQARTDTTWTIALYSKDNWEGDYYLLSGISENFDKCLDLHDPDLSDNPADNTWCEWFTSGGMDTTACDASTLTTPVSLHMINATCEVFTTTDCSSGSTVREYAGSDNGCMNYDDEPLRVSPWGSLAWAWNESVCHRKPFHSVHRK
ncbi:hypothetical protein BDV39DRAFT_206072 [Aspergillus sergii]|uniref:Secreted LysM effector LysM C-terminal domain-containing protein n=1 Tax=Aspergillus sergii TaxID=1034303 RepID=A0A5N6X1I5_9EURO|nr:hypothetical protein BDV39DRAFT_206072 [Aspergillus sergii]